MSEAVGRAAVVGGGLAGLIAAVALARGGASVTVFEAAHELGGRARTRNVDGFAFNQGPHALYKSGALMQTLTSLGVAVSGAAPPLRGARGSLMGRLELLPTSLEALATTRLLGGRDKLAFVRLQRAFLDGRRPEGAFDAWLAAQRPSPRLQALVLALVRLSTYVDAPELLAAGATLEQLRRALGGVLYLDGGWRSLIDGLAGAARAAGVAIRTETRIARVASTAQGATLTLSDGESHAVDAAILAVPPKAAADALGRAPAFRRAAEAQTPVLMSSLDLGLARLPEGAPNFALGIDRPLYFSVHSNGVRNAPPGAALVHVARYHRPSELPRRDVVSELEAYADAVMPGWRAHERARQTLIGLPVAYALVGAAGPRLGAATREAPHVFFAGDWVGDEGMLSDAAAASGRCAAAAALADLRSARVGAL